MVERNGVCSLSGLSIGREPVRVVLLNEVEGPRPEGVDGAWSARGPALSARYEPDVHEPVEWREDVCMRLAREQCVVDLRPAPLRRNTLDDVLRGLPSEIRFTTRSIRWHHHPDTQERVAPPKVSAWLPTPRRVAAALARLGVEAEIVPARRGVVFACPVRPADRADPRRWCERVAVACFGADFVAEETTGNAGRGVGMLVCPERREVGADDVREALRTAGWIEDAPGGFDVATDADGVHRVFYLPPREGTTRAAACREALVRRLRLCGIECCESGDRSCVVVPRGFRSVDSLARMSGVVALDDASNPLWHILIRPPKPLALRWAIVREDVWHGLLGTPGRDVDFERRKRTALELFGVLLRDAAAVVASWDRLSRVYPDVEAALAPTSGLFRAVAREDSPYRVGANWSLRHLAAMRARDEVTAAAAADALVAFAELAHVEHVVADANVRWLPATFAHRSSVRTDVGASVREAWARLATADAAGCR